MNNRTRREVFAASARPGFILYDHGEEVAP
jgi:hypothetical protein